MRSASWVHPLQLLRERLIEEDARQVWRVAAFTGAMSTAMSALVRQIGDDPTTLLAVLPAAMLFGIPSGFVAVWVLAYLVRLAGCWAGSSVRPQQTRTVVAWSVTPMNWALVLVVVAAIVVALAGHWPEADPEILAGDEAESAITLPRLIASAIVAGLWTVSIAFMIAGTRLTLSLSWPRAAGVVGMALLLAFAPLGLFVLVPELAARAGA